MSDLPHSWNVTPKEAALIQTSLRDRVERTDRLGAVALVAGVDVSVRAGVSRASIVVLSYPALEHVETALAERPTAFPYVPGLLSFREAPAVLDAWARLRRHPDLVIFDGQGIAHPRRMGLASHLGLVLDRPSIGCAKSRLTGEAESPAEQMGAWSPLTDAGENIGAVLRTRAGVRPVFVSTGHRVCLTTAVDIVLRCCRRYRLPEPTRLAHLTGRDEAAWRAASGRKTAS